MQEHKEMEAIKKRLSEESPRLSEDERTRAAELIQRNYRGHRERRALDGKGLDASTRWVEAIKEARYRNLTQPRPRSSGEGVRPSVDARPENGGPGLPSPHNAKSTARQNWKKIGLIARRAGGDEDSDEQSGGDDENLPDNERDERRKRRVEEKMERVKAAKIMDLQYFLEMVDLKHRYGSMWKLSAIQLLVVKKAGPCMYNTHTVIRGINSIRPQFPPYRPQSTIADTMVLQVI